MKITKYEHACLAVEEQGKILIIDPGAFTRALPQFKNVGAVVITHVHPDHFDPQHLTPIIKNNPNVQIFSTKEVSKELGEKLVTVVTGGDFKQIDPFNLEFYGNEHAVIHNSYPNIKNIGLMVNSQLYYPGDSFSKPDLSIEVLAVPAVAPWMKLSEAMDFIAQVKPKTVFPTHNALYSDIGQNLADRLLGEAARNSGAQYKSLKPGESLEV